MILRAFILTFLFSGFALAQVNTSPDEALSKQEERILGLSEPSAQTGVDPLDTQAEVEELEAEPDPVRYEQHQTATLRALDKITGRSTNITVETGTPIVFGSLNVELQTCYQTEPEFPPESAAFLTINSVQAVQVDNMDDGVDASVVKTVSEDNPRLFSGWMFASSPGLSALEHAVYDVWVINCTADEPVTGTSGE